MCSVFVSNLQVAMHRRTNSANSGMTFRSDIRNSERLSRVMVRSIRLSYCTGWRIFPAYTRLISISD